MARPNSNNTNSNTQGRPKSGGHNKHHKTNKDGSYKDNKTATNNAMINSTHVSEADVLDGGFSTIGTVKISLYPAVPLGILGAYSRKVSADSKTPIIACLIGTNVDGVIHVVDYFIESVTQAEDDSLVFDELHHKDLLDYKIKALATPGAQIVGQAVCSIDSSVLNHMHNWITGKTMQSKWSVSRILPQPIIVSLDPEMTNGKFSMKTFQMGPTRSCFQECPTRIHVHDNERAATELVLRSYVQQQATGSSEGRDCYSSIVDDNKSFEEACKRYRAICVKAKEYVDKVVSGEVTPNPMLGRELLEAVVIDPLYKEFVSDENLKYNEDKTKELKQYGEITRMQFDIAKKLATSLK